MFPFDKNPSDDIIYIFTVFILNVQLHIVSDSTHFLLNGTLVHLHGSYVPCA